MGKAIEKQPEKFRHCKMPELKIMTDSALLVRLGELYARQQHAGFLKEHQKRFAIDRNVCMGRNCRKEIARIKTLLKQREGK